MPQHAHCHCHCQHSLPLAGTGVGSWQGAPLNLLSFPVPNPEKFKRKLQRAAFGTGGDSDSASRSSMLESLRDSMSAESQAQSLRESRAEVTSSLRPGDYPTGSPASVRASCGSGSVSDSQSGILSGMVLPPGVCGSVLLIQYHCRHKLVAEGLEPVCSGGNRDGEAKHPQ